MNIIINFKLKINSIIYLILIIPFSSLESSYQSQIHPEEITKQEETNKPSIETQKTVPTSDRENTFPNSFCDSSFSKQEQQRVHVQALRLKAVIENEELFNNKNFSELEEIVKKYDQFTAKPDLNDYTSTHERTLKKYYSLYSENESDLPEELQRDIARHHYKEVMKQKKLMAKQK